MKSLTPPQIRQLQAQLYESGATPAQTNALLPLLVHEVEHYMWIGLPFESALHKVELEADFNPVTYLRQKHQDTLVATDDDQKRLSLDDIVFANRNKAYGAYDLRKAYNQALINAFVMTIGLVMLGLSALQAWQAGKWTYLSWTGAAWIAGILMVAFAAFRFYVERITHEE